MVSMVSMVTLRGTTDSKMTMNLNFTFQMFFPLNSRNCNHSTIVVLRHYVSGYKLISEIDKFGNFNISLSCQN
jgi:hypothetical protein